MKKHDPYRSNDIAEYNRLLLRLKNHFCQNPEYYVTDLLKILTAVNELDDPRLEQWSAYEEENGLENLMYQDFCDFLKHLIKDLGML
jgi:hypothetical protein